MKKYLNIIFAAVMAVGVGTAVVSNTPQTAHASVTWHTTDKYVQVTSKKYSIWDNTTFTKKWGWGTTNDSSVYKHTYRVRNYFKNNGNTYYWLERGGVLQGYLNSKATKTVSNMHGNRVSMNRYIRITNNNDTVWRSDWSANFSTYYKGMSHTYQVKGIYYAANGNDYYSLYNGAKWVGYINTVSTQKVNSAQGIPLDQYKKYVKITGAKTNVWNDFGWKKIRHYSKNYLKHTYELRRLYYHSNGQTYYSLYNGNKWFGYINANSVKSVKTRQGDIVVPSTMYTKIKSGSQTLWGDFDWHKKLHNSSSYMGKIFQVKGIYYHSNGNKYYSLYNGKTWMGYLNATFTSPIKSAAVDQYVRPNSKNYAIWTSFAFTQKNGTTSQYRGKTLHVKAKYYHGNGNVFMSVYNGSKWLGYVNAAGLTVIK